MKKQKTLSTIPVGVKSSIAFFISNVISTGIKYLTTPLYTRLLTSEEFGQVSIFLTWLQVFGIIAMFCLSYGVFNNGMLDFPDKRDEYSFSMLALSNVITIGFSIILLTTYPFTKNIIGLDFPILVLMCVIFLFQPAYLFWVAKQKYEYKYKASLIWAILSAVVSPLVAMVCILCFPGNRLYARIFGAEVCLILIYAGFYLYIAKKAQFKINAKYWKYALLFNLPLIPHYLSTYLLGSSDKIMISRLIGDSQAAYYNVAYSVASVAMIIWSAANASLVPYSFEKCKKGQYKDIDKTVKPILCVFALLCFTVILLAPEVVSIMATSEYKEAIFVIPPIVGGVFFQVLYYVFANIVFYYKKTKYIMFGSFAAVSINVVLNFIFIKKYGYFAAGYTTLFCYMIQAIIDYFAMRKAAGCNVYDMKFILLLSVSNIVICLLSCYLYTYTLVRYIILCVFFSLAVLFRKKILRAFRF